MRHSFFEIKFIFIIILCSCSPHYRSGEVSSSLSTATNSSTQLGPAAAAAAGDSGPGTTEAAAGTEDSGQWQRAGSAFLQQAQRAAVAAVVGGVARSTVARIPIVGADCMLTEKKPKQSKLCTVFSFLEILGLSQQ